MPYDRNNPTDAPLTDEEFERGLLALRLRRLRNALGLDQRGFSERYRIPLGTLRDWEQGKALPDQASRSYITVIERMPEEVARSLAAE